VPTSVVFGAVSILMVKALVPLVNKGLNTLSEALLDILAYVLVSIVLIDTTLIISLMTDFRRYVVLVDGDFKII